MTFDPDAPASPDAGVYGLPHTPEQAKVVLIPVPWDPTTSYRSGAADGPEAIRRASRQVDLHDVETGDPWEGGIHMLFDEQGIRQLSQNARRAAVHVIDAGGVTTEYQGEMAKTVAEHSEEVNRLVRVDTERWLGAGKIVGIVGGDHSVSYGAIEAVAARHPGVGILHFDAHADLRNAYEGLAWSHASIMYNVMTRIAGVAKLVQVGIRDVGQAEIDFIEESGGRIVTHFEPNLAALRFAGESFADQCARIIEPLPKEVYVSFDIDGLDPAYCPHTGTPVPGGLTFAQACFLLRVLGESGRRIVGFDLTEVAPAPRRTVADGEEAEVADEWDGNVGARILYKMIGWAVRSQT